MFRQECENFDILVNDNDSTIRADLNQTSYKDPCSRQVLPSEKRLEDNYDQKVIEIDPETIGVDQFRRHLF